MTNDEGIRGERTPPGKEVNLYEPPHDLIFNILTEDSFDLTPTALEHLAESGISESTAKEHHLRCIPQTHGRNGSSWQPLLNMRWRYEWGESLFFPHFETHKLDDDCYFVRTRPMWPDGRPDDGAKYYQPKDVAHRLYFTKGVVEGLRSKTLRKFYVTEGEKKALCLWQRGCPAISIPGVHMGLKPKSKYKLHPDLQQFDLEGVEVVIAFDSDITDNKDNKKGQDRLRRAFESVGAKVYILRLSDGGDDPKNFDGSKNGVDDFAVSLAGDDEVFRSSLDERCELSVPDKPLVSSANKEDLATDYLAGRPSPIVRWQDLREYDSDKHCWTRRDPEDEAAVVYQYLCASYQNVATRAAREVVDAIGFQNRLPASRPAPFWIDVVPGGFENLNECIITPDWVVNLRTGEATLNDSRLFATHTLNAKYDPGAGADPKRYIDFLNGMLRHEYQVLIRQEFGGLCLVPDTSKQVTLNIVGDPGSGKGTDMRIQEQMHGRENVAWMTFENLVDKYKRAHLIGKSNLFVADAMNCRGAVAAGACEFLKNVTGEDAVTVEQKYKDPMTVKLTLKVTITSNELISFPDPSFSMGRRILPLRSYGPEGGRREKVIEGLSEEIFEAESSQILNFYIEGWRRLSERGFTKLPEDGPGREMLRMQRRMGSPVSAFLEEECELGAGCVCHTAELYQRWEVWCRENGHHPGSAQSFGAKLSAAAPDVEWSKGPRVMVGDKSVQHAVYWGVQMIRTPEGCEKLRRYSF